MAAAATRSSTFNLFPHLPPELRNQIWRDVLPDKLDQALYIYRKGCWRPRRLSESDDEYDPEKDELNLNFEFRHDLLDDVQYEVPLAFVNSEARGIALAWVCEQSIEIRPRQDGKYPVFVRPFDPKRDALYVPLDRWDEFLCEPSDRQFEPDLYEKFVCVKADLTRIAVPEAVLRSELASLPEIFDYLSNLKVLFVVVDAPLDLQSADSEMKMQRRWEFESSHGGAYIWNDGRRSFDFRGNKYTGDETLSRLIQEANEKLGEGLVWNHFRSFEVCPAFAVRR